MHVAGASHGMNRPGYSTYDDVRITEFDDLSKDGNYDGDDRFEYKSDERSYRDMLLRFLDNTSAFWSIFLLVAEYIVLQTFDPEIFETRDVHMGWKSTFCTTLLVGAQVYLILYSGWTLILDIAKLNPISITRLVNGWLAFALGFSFLYLAIFISDPAAFRVDGWVGEDHHSRKKALALHQMEGHVPGVLVGFVYFSLSVLTSAGFGDVICRGMPAQILCCLEMLIGVIFSVVIFGWALHYFQTQVGEDVVSQFRDHYEMGFFRRVISWVRHHVPGVEMMRKFVIAYLLLVVIGIQVGTLCLIEMLDPTLIKDPDVATKPAFMALCILQGFLLMLLLSVSLRIAFKMHDHVEIGLSFLVQSYLSIIVLFDGVYLLVFLIDKDAFKIPFVEELDDLTITAAMWKLLYFSFTAMTTTGFGDITPRLMIGRIVVALHLVVSQMYHILILGLGTAIFVSRQQVGITKTRQNLRQAQSWGGSLGMGRKERRVHW